MSRIALLALALLGSSRKGPDLRISWEKNILTIHAADVPGGLHRRSLVPILEGRTDEHRPWVFSTYTQNEEGMIRTPEWKLIVGAGRLKRDDGYETHDPTPGRTRRLYDLRKDPEEMRDVSAANPGGVARLQRLLHDRLRETWDDVIPLPGGLSEEERIDFMLRAPERLKKK